MLVKDEAFQRVISEICCLTRLWRKFPRSFWFLILQRRMGVLTLPEPCEARGGVWLWEHTLQTQLQCTVWPWWLWPEGGNNYILHHLEQTIWSQCEVLLFHERDDGFHLAAAQVLRTVVNTTKPSLLFGYIILFFLDVAVQFKNVIERWSRQMWNSFLWTGKLHSGAELPQVCLVCDTESFSFKT